MFKLGHFKMDKEPEAAGGAAPAAATPAPDAPAPEVKWESMVDDPLPPDSDEDDPAGGTPPVENPTPPPEKPPETPPVTPPVTPPPTPPVPPQKTTEEQAAEAKVSRDRLHGELSGIYEKGLSEDDKAALLADPVSVMPKLLAQAAMDGAALAMREFHHILPNYLVNHTKQTETVKTAWTEFDKAHPDLAKPEYRQATISAINTIKASGQKLDKEKAMAAVARTTRAILGLDTPTETSTPPESPAAAPVAPFTPTGRGAAAPRKAGAGKPTDSPWEALLD